MAQSMLSAPRSELVRGGRANLLSAGLPAAPVRTLRQLPQFPLYAPRGQIGRPPDRPVPAPGAQCPAPSHLMDRYRAIGRLGFPVQNPVSSDHQIGETGRAFIATAIGRMETQEV